MKALKIIGVIVAILVLLILVAGGIAVYRIDSLAKSGVTEGGTYALGVPVSVDDVDVGLLAGTVTLDDFKVANPEGYEAENFLTVGNGRVEVDLGTLRKDLVEMGTLVLEDITLNVERNSSGGNYTVIMDNLKKFEGKTDPDAPHEKKPGKQFVIHQLAIRNVKAHVLMSPLGGAVETTTDVEIKEILLEDVGTGGSGKSLAEVADIVVKTLLEAVIASGAGIIPDDIARELRDGLGGLESLADLGVSVAVDAGDGLQNVVGGVSDAAREIGDEAADALEGVGDAATDAVKDIGDGVKGLFGGDDDKPADEDDDG